MTINPGTLSDRLHELSWRHLVAILAANQLSMTTSKAKPALIAQIHAHLTETEVLTAIIAQLDGVGKGALRALLAGNGALPVHTFEGRFGPVRAYRPWHKDDQAGDGAGVAQPWLAPISVTERLWYLGLIYRDPPKRQPGSVQHYVIPGDLAPHLATLLAEPLDMAPYATVQHPGRHGALDHHLAIWLATIHAPLAGQAIKPVHQRWLPPSVVALLCTRLGLDQAPDFRSVKSERYLPYLAFLHYLALAAELIVVTPTAMQLTPVGWEWLTAEPVTRQAHLCEAWRRAPLDLAQPFRFLWEPLTVPARAFLLEQLGHLSAEQPVDGEMLLEQWRLLDSQALFPEPHPVDWRDESALCDLLVEVIRGPLHWLGLVRLSVRQGDRETGRQGDKETGRQGAQRAPRETGREGETRGPEGTPGDRGMGFGVCGGSLPVNYAQGVCTMPKQPGNTIVVPITVLPLHLVRLARFCDWAIAPVATALPHTFTLVPERIAQLAAWGSGPDEVVGVLMAALGRRPSRRVVQRVRAWARPGQQLRLRPLLVLEAENGELLAQLRRHKLVRKRLGEVVAPNRVALDPADAAALAQTLRTLGYFVEPPSTPSTGSGAEAAGAGDRPGPSTGSGGGLSPALQWFLITLYQGMGQHLPLSLELPWEVRQALRSQLSALQQASAESAAKEVLDRLQAALSGYLQLPAWSMPATEAPEPVIQRALDQGHDIEIRYWGPADGHVTTRVVTPYWIEERHQSRYLIGWCHLRQQERTFRLDRIEAVEVRGRG